MVGSFAVLAALLGVVGLYGVVAYSVGQRTREIGVRMALGAQRGTIYGLVLKEAGRLTVLGVAAGLVCSVAVLSLMGKLLFQVKAWDVPTLLGVSLLLGVAALAGELSAGASRGFGESGGGAAGGVSAGRTGEAPSARFAKFASFGRSRWICG